MFERSAPRARRPRPAVRRVIWLFTEDIVLCVVERVLWGRACRQRSCVQFSYTGKQAVPDYMTEAEPRLLVYDI